jgi:asparagine synthase (glutamine-hydrolysing)
LAEITMCGICGKTSDPRASAVAAMNRLMVHRGPDDEGRYVDPSAGVALGARRLSIIDVAGGHQPLSNEDGTIWAVLNGEIYNHPELRCRLAAGGHTLATGTDTEVLVHLYEEFGPALVHALEGMYAFAIWDGRRGRLLVCRDRFGEKPMFYAERDGVLTFASELTALCAGHPIECELDEAALDAFFVYGYVSGPGAILRGVHQLPPGSVLTWERDRPTARIDRYWSPPRSLLAGTPEPEDLAAEVERILEKSVRSRMIADVPLGVFLSGGLDSTLLAYLAARNAPGSIKTFTVGYESGDVSETAAARAAAEHVGSQHHELIFTDADVATEVPALLAALDQPLADPALVPLHAVARFARREVTVAVGGEGADELFGGYPRYRWLARAHRVARVVPAEVARAAAGAARRLSTSSAHRLADVLEPKPSVERHIDWVTARRRYLRSHTCGPRLRERAGQSLFERELMARAGGPLGAGGFMRLDQVHWLPDDVLAKADRAGMLASLEIRTPYLHRELAELAASIPEAVHLAGSGKALLRQILVRVMPDRHDQPRKTAFRTPTREWLRGPLADALRASIGDGRLYRDGWFDGAAAERLRLEHAAGIRDWSAVLWPLLTLGIWFDHVTAPRAA